MVCVCVCVCVYLASSQYVIPDGRSSKVDVEVCETALHTHQAVP